MAAGRGDGSTARAWGAAGGRARGFAAARWRVRFKAGGHPLRSHAEQIHTRTCAALLIYYGPQAMKLTRYLALMSLLSIIGVTAQAEPIKIGEAAPKITATTDAGTALDLADVYKKNNYTLVWFYPKALTGGCTKQGCSLRDASAELKKKGVAVIGVSTDTVEKQKEFKDKNNFDYPLLADTEKKVLKAFGQSGGMMASREAYLIDRQGKVVYYDKGQTEKQAEMVLAFLNAKKS